MSLWIKASAINVNINVVQVIRLSVFIFLRPVPFTFVSHLSVCHIGILIRELDREDIFLFLTGVTGLVEMDKEGNREIDFALWDMTDTDTGVYQVASF